MPLELMHSVCGKIFTPSLSGLYFLTFINRVELTYSRARTKCLRNLKMEGNGREHV